MNSELNTAISNQLRPIVMLVASVSICVCSLLVTTASLGASPINSMEVTVLE